MESFIKIILTKLKCKNGEIPIQSFRKLPSLQDIEKFIQSHPLTFLYITQPKCSVCHGLEPQLIPIFEKYPKIHTGRVDSEEVPEIAGQFQVFTAPVALLFLHGEEYIRKARFIPVTELDYEISRIYENMVD